MREKEWQKDATRSARENQRELRKLRRQGNNDAYFSSSHGNRNLVEFTFHHAPRDQQIREFSSTATRTASDCSVRLWEIYHRWKGQDAVQWFIMCDWGRSKARISGTRSSATVDGASLLGPFPTLAKFTTLTEQQESTRAKQTPD